MPKQQVEMPHPIYVMMAAGEIPDDTVVAKPTGRNQYTLTRNIKIYVKDDTGAQNQEVRPTADSVFLVGIGGSTSIEQYGPDHMLKIGFDSSEEAIEFLGSMSDDK